MWDNAVTIPGIPGALLSNPAPNSVTGAFKMLKCKGLGCKTTIPEAVFEASLQAIAANIPAWIVKRPDRRVLYAKRVFGPRCGACCVKIIKELHA